MNTLRNKIELLLGDITKIKADVIVNAANSSLLGGGGVDGAIHRAGGKEILEECKKIVARQGGCKTGEAVITTGGKLPSRFVIHTVGPVWNGGNRNEAKNLASCYKNSLQLAVENQCRTIAFPCISTGVYGYPPEQAAQVAVEVIYEFLKQSERIDKVILVCFDDSNFQFTKHHIESLLK